MENVKTKPASQDNGDKDAWKNLDLATAAGEAASFT